VIRRSTRGAVAALVLVLVAAALPTPAAAHLWLRSSEPADGAHLDAVPREIRMRFSEPVELAFTRLELLGPGGSRVPLGEFAVPTGEPSVLVVAIDGLIEPGAYTIVWRTTSADGHPVNGRIGFSVDAEAEGLEERVADEPAAAAPLHHDPEIFPDEGGFTAGSPGFVVVRWLTFVGLLGVIGIVAFKLLVLSSVRRARVTEALPLLAPLTRGSATLGLAFSFLLVAAVLARLYAQALALHGPGEALDWAAISAILNRTTWGVGWLLQAAATLVALAGFTVARHQSRGDARYVVGAADSHPRTDAPRAEAAAVSGDAQGGTTSGGVATDVAEHEIAAQDERSGADGSGIGIGWALAALGVVMLAFTPALGGHAVATPDRTWLAVLSDGLHVLGAGGWLGSLLAVVAIGIPVAMHLGREGRGRAVAALVNAFSPTALFFAVIVTATGVLSASFHLGSFADLWQSDYGRTLLLKIGVLSLLFATGAYNWLRVRPALGSEDGARRLRRSASLELGVGVVVLLVTAVLVATPPPMDMERATDQPAVEAAS